MVSASEAPRGCMRLLPAGEIQPFRRAGLLPGRPEPCGLPTGRTGRGGGQDLTISDYGEEAREQAFLDVQTTLTDALMNAAGQKAGVAYSLDMDALRERIRAGYAETILKAIDSEKVLQYDRTKKGRLSVMAHTVSMGDITTSSLKRNVSQFKKEVNAFR